MKINFFWKFVLYCWHFSGGSYFWHFFVCFAFKFYILRKRSLKKSFINCRKHYFYLNYFPSVSLNFALLSKKIIIFTSKH